MNKNKIIDISRKIHENSVVWPGDRHPKINRDSLIKNGDVCNVSSIEIGLHVGTHIDAPLHFIDEGTSICSLDLSKFIGTVKVFELSVEKFISEKDIESLLINKGDIIFFKTKNSLLPDDTFYKNYIYIDISAAKYLAFKQIRTVGIDYYSIGGFHSENEKVHKILLSNNIGVIEGLNLTNASTGEYYFSCLPLYIHQADGSPARAVLIEK